MPPSGAPVSPGGEPVAPSAPLPPPSGPPIPTYPAAPALAPTPTYGYVPPPPPGRPRWLIPVIAGGSALLLVVVALVVVGAVALGSFYRDLPGGGTDGGSPVVGAPAPPIAGDPGSPLASDPLDCVGCFTYSDATRLRLAFIAYSDLGLEYADGELFDTTVAEDRAISEQNWADVGGEPSECYFAFPQAPLGHTLGEGSAEADDDRVHYPSWHSDEDEYYWLTEGVRLFDDSAGATAYMEGLAAAVDGCDTYSLPDSGWSGRVIPAAALTVPDEVAAYGWIETAGYSRYYVIDLQRGNLVQRLTLSSDGVGPREAQFRMFAEAYAELLAELEPSGTSAG